MRDIAGIERSHVSGAIAGAVPITPERLAAIQQIRARVDILWAQAEGLAPQSTAPTGLLQAQTQARVEYFGSFRSLNDDMRSRSESGRPYDTPVDQFVARTTPQLGSLLNVMVAAGAESELRAAAIRNESLGGVVSGALLLALGLP